MRGFGFVLFKDRLGYLRVFDYGETHMIRGKQVRLADQIECRRVLLRDELQSQTPKVAASSSQKELPQFSLDPEQATYMLQAYQLMLASQFPNLGELPQVDPMQFQTFLQNFQSQFAAPFSYSDSSIDNSSSYYSHSSDSNPEDAPLAAQFYPHDSQTLHQPPRQKYPRSPASFITNASEICGDGEWEGTINSGETERYSFCPGPGGSYMPETKSHRNTVLQDSLQERPRTKTSGNRSDQQLLKALNSVIDDDDASDSSDFSQDFRHVKHSSKKPYPRSLAHKLYGKHFMAKQTTHQPAPAREPSEQKSEQTSDAVSLSKPPKALDRYIDLNQVFSGENWIFVQDIPPQPEYQFTKKQNNPPKVVDTAEEGDDLYFGFKLIEPLPPSAKTQPTAGPSNKKASNKK